MNHAQWEAMALAISRKIETGGRNVDADAVPNFDVHRPLVDQFIQHLSPTANNRGTGRARVLAPGAMVEALSLAQAGFEVHPCVLGPDNLAWLNAQAQALGVADRVVARELDAHDLDYPEGFFDGYFSSQFNEHLIAPFVHIGEVRRSLRDGAIVFVDACGINDPAFHIVWHTNLVPEAQVLAQWTVWGFHELWRDTHADNGPRFVFEKLPANDLRWACRERLAAALRDIGANDSWETKWARYLDASQGNQPSDSDIRPDAASQAMHRYFLETFMRHLPPPACGAPPVRVLAPGAMREAFLLVEAGYTVNVLQYDQCSVDWLVAERTKLSDEARGRLYVHKMDAHALEFPAGVFDGCFSTQFYAHLLAWPVFLGELRYASKPDAVVFVDTSGTASARSTHCPNRVPVRTVHEQWDYWGFHVLWEGPSGDERPQFVFRMRDLHDPKFRHAGYLQWALRLRDGEPINFAYSCARCER